MAKAPVVNKKVLSVLSDIAQLWEKVRSLKGHQRTSLIKALEFSHHMICEGDGDRLDWPVVDTLCFTDFCAGIRVGLEPTDHLSHTDIDRKFGGE
jgi:hypothetical protein